MPRRLILAGALVLAGALAACSGDAPAPRPTGTYVALGDSYVAGPAIGKEDPAEPACRRSFANYPHLVAKALDVAELADVSCGGATTQSVRDGRSLKDELIEPQLDAITRDTKLVTLGIGGNDSGLSAGLFSYCLIPASASNEACRTFASDAPAALETTRAQVGALLGRVQQLAPRARVVLVGYLRLIPDSGRCKVLPVNATRREQEVDVEDDLNAALKAAAEQAGARYVDVYRLSRGHDACAGDDAWTNGIVNPPGDGAFLHPNAAGMRQVADEVLQVVKDG